MKETVRFIILALRPKQWIKNILLLVAPFAAGVSPKQHLLTVILGLVTFALASSFGYVLNDLNDIQIDSKHPKKKNRPFASGALSINSGYVIAGSLFVILIITSYYLPFNFKLIVFLYLLNTFFYTKVLKIVAVLELFAVSFGFVLRLIAGGVLLHLDISEWFLIVGGFGALFIVISKRLAEVRQIQLREVRHVARQYSISFLNSGASISITICITGYLFWAFSQKNNPFWFQLSVIPFVISFFRYIWISEQQIVETPEDAILGDVLLLTLGTLLIFILSIAIYQ